MCGRHFRPDVSGRGGFVGIWIGSERVIFGNTCNNKNNSKIIYVGLCFFTNQSNINLHKLSNQAGGAIPILHALLIQNFITHGKYIVSK